MLAPNTGQNTTENVEQKTLKAAEKKYFNQLLGVRSTRKLVKIHNKK